MRAGDGVHHGRKLVRVTAERPGFTLRMVSYFTASDRHRRTLRFKLVAHHETAHLMRTWGRNHPPRAITEKLSMTRLSGLWQSLTHECTSQSGRTPRQHLDERKNKMAHRKVWEDTHGRPKRDPSDRHVRVNSVVRIVDPPSVSPLSHVYFTDPRTSTSPANDDRIHQTTRHQFLRLRTHLAIAAVSHADKSVGRHPNRGEAGTGASGASLGSPTGSACTNQNSMQCQLHSWQTWTSHGSLPILG